jgi:hypothetical protein
MAFRNPFAAYNAANNIEAHLVCAALQDVGIEALVVENVSQVGTWLGGFVSETNPLWGWHCTCQAKAGRSGSAL